MTPLAKLVVRVLAFVLLVALALAGLAAAVFSIQTGTGTLSYSNLMSLIGGPAIRDFVGGVLDDIEGKQNDLLTALLGLAAILLGLFLLLGLAGRNRERIVTLSSGSEGRVAARPRPLAQAASTLVGQARGVTDTDVRVKPRGGAGGTLQVRADHPRREDPGEVQRTIEERLQPLAEPFGLRTRVQTRVGGHGSRVS